MKKNISVALLAVTVSGCATFRPLVLAQDKWSGVCVLRLVVITKNGQSRWNDWSIQARTEWLEPSFRKMNLRFILLPTEWLEKPEWINVREEVEFRQMAKASRIRSRTRMELTVWLVDHITKDSFVKGGLAYMPSNMLEDYQYGIVLSLGGPAIALVHEIGHYFNLAHTWLDPFIDTPSNGKDDCESDPCNAMGYCGNRWPEGNCLGHTFSNQQIGEMRAWVQCPPRSEVVTILHY